MKRFLLTGAAIVFSASLFSQIFTDDFESYVAGQKLVVQNPTDWDTWTAPYTAAEDVDVSNANAQSGNNSLYFASNGGGPEDIILRYANVYTSGDFSLEMEVFVENGKGAYFNMQETWVVGAVWAIDCFMLNTGTLKLSNGGTPYLTTTYPTGAWFTLRIDIDLTTNNWELFIDNVSQGSFSNPINSIGILDLYPTNPTTEGGNNISGFYIDDVTYNHVPASLPPVNGGVTLVSQLNGVVGSTPAVEATVRNLGTNNITSFDIQYVYNGGPPVIENVSAINLVSLANYVHTFATPVTLVAGTQTLTVTISNVNGAGPDADPSDDFKSITVTPAASALGKVVFGEEATGTWCQWCPRGAVYMDYMETTYSSAWAGVAVHNNDPMADATYDTGLGALISGYPSAVVDRGPAADPQTLEQSFLNRVIIPPTAFITNGATYNASTRVLEVSVTTDWQTAASGNWRLGCVITEDGVTGTSAAYAQSNAYAGGGNGVMGGYELLPNPVPASQMVYDHVARAIAPSFDGGATFPASMAAGLLYTECFTFNIDPTWDDTKIKIISFLRAPSGLVDNAGKETIASAVVNGLAVCGVGVTEATNLENNFKLFPNPTNGVTFIDIIDANNSNVNVTIMDMSGKIVGQRDYKINGTMQLPIETNNLDKGIYIVTLTNGDSVQQQKLIVQ